MPLLLLVLMGTMVGMGFSAQAEIFYVSPDGLKDNPGSSNAPLRTLQQAVDKMKAGDVVVVAPGDYLEHVRSKRDGTLAHPITFRASGPNVFVSAFFLNHANHVVKGFAITGHDVPQYKGAVTIQEAANSITLQGNVFESSPTNVYQLLMERNNAPDNLNVKGNSFLNGNFHAITLYGGGHLIESNLFTTTNGWDAIRLLSSQTVVRGNIFTNWSNLRDNANHPDLVQSFSVNGDIAQSNVIEGNLAVDCVKVQIGNIEDHTSLRVGNWVWRNNVFVNVEYAMHLSAPGMKFYNNLFYNSGRNTGGPICFRFLPGKGMGTGGEVFNNIFYHCGMNPGNPTHGWYLVDPGIFDLSADHNLVVGVGKGRIKQNFSIKQREEHGLNGLDPLFYSAASNDFRLMPGSAAIDQGKTLNHLFTNDFAGRQRRTNWDLGPYEMEPTKLLQDVK